MKISSKINSQCQNDLKNHGYCIDKISIDEGIIKAVKAKDYASLDSLIWKEIAQDGAIYNMMKQYCDFSEIEFIISLRQEDNEDGIWHDDGSRILAFSLSLTTDPPQGGILEIRQKGDQKSHKISTPKFGDIIIFQTGVQNYEHKINKVTKGTRLIIAGWCYK